MTTNPSVPFYSWYLNYQQSQPWAFIENCFSAEECEQIKAIGDSLPATIAKVGGENPDEMIVKNELRKNTLSWIDSNNPDHQWIHRRCTDAVIGINQQFWNYDLHYIETLQYTMYNELEDKYDAHLDCMWNGVHNRKLSFSLLLDDDETYTGGDFEICTGADFVAGPRKQGTLIAFPSWLLHRVTPIKSGQRRSLVGWVCGPQFK